MNSELLITPKPKTAAILITYQCIAQCDECCFACNPHLAGTTISLQLVKKFLDTVSKIDSIKIVVFSGGECFLEFKLLKESIEYATSLGLSTRCVTNGYWASNLVIATKKVALLKKSGLTEINLSTGDSHQQFVPIKRVLNATIASLQADITTCVSVETNKNKQFTEDDFKKHPLYLQYIKNNSIENKLLVMSTVWVSFHTDNIYDYSYEAMKPEKGCNGVFDTIAIEPRTGLIGCCGLTVNNISEMHLGQLDKVNLQEVLSKQYNDFLKIWIFIDGPEKIVNTSARWLNEAPPIFAHKCLYCAYLYNNQAIKSVIYEKMNSIIDDVLERYYKKCLVFNYAE